MKRAALVTLVILLCAAPLIAQTVTIRATDPSTGADVQAVGDDANDALRVSQAGSWLVSGVVAVSQSGTWTVQPGNTANSTAWLVTGLGGTFPATQSGTWNITNISGTVSLPTGAATSTKQSDGSQKTQIVDGSGNVIGATSNALDVNIKSGNPTTITVTQGTATNLKTQAEAYVGGAAVSTSAPMPTDVRQIGGSSVSTAATGVQKVGIVGNAGASLDATVGAGTAPTNMVVVGGQYNSSAPSPTTGQTVAMQLSSKGETLQVIRDAAGNARGANVNSSNQLLTTDSASSATGSAVPANATYTGAINHSGNLVGDIACDQQKIYDASTNGSTELVAISGSTHVYICGYEMHIGGTATNVKLTAGTGTNCGSAISGTPSTGTSGANAGLTPAWQMTANGGRVSMFPRGTVIDAGSGNAVCLNASAGNAVQAILFYSQR